eukprot:CAMPEP_0197558210 /NCGR_PEP_ID=MMETSP1320-20131121/18712_1 /TAXON_ID=91990 /ORGANISM="Bolidomonas sp., Strain RCC2347" /LENGTH=47 /DNA_ID= /DNA_START= /DNA_END= /DNA_ORIENTATION=
MRKPVLMLEGAETLRRFARSTSYPMECQRVGQNDIEDARCARIFGSS